MPTSEHELSPRNVHSRMKRNQQALWNLGHTDRHHRLLGSSSAESSSSSDSTPFKSELRIRTKKRFGLGQAIERKHHVRRRERVAAVEFDVRKQREQNHPLRCATFPLICYGESEKPRICGQEKYYGLAISLATA